MKHHRSSSSRESPTAFAVTPLLFAALIVLPSACARTESAGYGITLRVESDPGVPVSGAQLVRDAKPLGTSDANGLLALTLQGAPGSEVELVTRCPDGYESPAQPLAITLRALAENRRPEYRVSCAPALRSVVLAVRAQHGANLPVKYLGKEIARTDEQGTAHAWLKLKPGETATISLDTSASTSLMPQHPELRLTVPAHDDVVLFDQTFSEAHKKRTHARRHAGPIRI